MAGSDKVVEYLVIVPGGPRSRSVPSCDPIPRSLSHQLRKLLHPFEHLVVVLAIQRCTHHADLACLIIPDILNELRSAFFAIDTDITSGGLIEEIIGQILVEHFEQ